MFTRVNQRALRLATILALVGTLGCASEVRVRWGPDDLRVDVVWAALQCGALEPAAEAAAAIEDETLRTRAQLDVRAAREGRAAAYVEALSRGSWLVARFAASGEQALEWLREERRRGGASPALWIEESRRSPSAGRALSAARAARDGQPGGLEALAIEAELLLAQGRSGEAAVLVSLARTARLELAHARLLAATGRLSAAGRAVLRAAREGNAVPASLALLQEILARVPLRELEDEARATLAGLRTEGPRLQRAQQRLLAWLAAERGDLPEAIACLQRCEPRAPDEDAALVRWRARLSGTEPPPVPLELRLDATEDRPRSPALLEKRLADEWDLAARAGYELADKGAGEDLGSFVRLLDLAAAGLPGAPRLSDLPRRDFGLFGEMLDTAPLRDSLPAAVVLCGKALTLPADIAWFDLQSCRSRELPDGFGRYEECEVRHARVNGYAASHGASITGAGIDPLVWIDLDQMEREERSTRLLPVGPPLPALAAAGREERRDLSEPLDVARWIDEAVRQQAGVRHDELLLDALRQHEQQHILDFRRFLSEGTGGRVALLLSGGLLPGAVQVEIERRAQLHALRTAEEPRLALCHAVSHLPVEGEARREPHAAAYGALVAEFVRRLDDGDWPASRSAGELGLDPRKNLLQQLHLLDAGTVRAIALAMDD